MAEPLGIVEAIEGRSRPPLIPPGVDRRPPGRSPAAHVLVTAGPTHEPIDPVRFIGNRSSGRQGHAIAEAAVGAGRAGDAGEPGRSPCPIRRASTVVHVQSAREMLAAVDAALPADAFIGAAAVADWRVEKVESEKMKKGAAAPPVLRLVENPDILARSLEHVAAARPRS